MTVVAPFAVMAASPGTDDAPAALVLGRWYEVECGFCDSEFVFPWLSPAARQVRCPHCAMELPLAVVTASARPTTRPPGAVQSQALLDAIAAEETVRRGDDDGGTATSGEGRPRNKQEALAKFQTPSAWPRLVAAMRFVELRLLSGASPPTLLGHCRVYSSTTRVGPATAACPLLDRFRRNATAAVLPVAVSPTAPFVALPATLTVVTVAAVALSHAASCIAFSAYPLAWRHGMVLLFASLLAIIWLHVREPGYVTTTVTRELLERDGRDVPANRQVSSDQWCAKCQAPRPSRAGHCGTCGVCVADLDHHCRALGVCVGRRNHRCFVLYLAVTAAGSLLAWYLLGVVLFNSDAAPAAAAAGEPHARPVGAEECRPQPLLRVVAIGFAFPALFLGTVALYSMGFAAAMSLASGLTIRERTKRLQARRDHTKAPLFPLEVETRGVVATLRHTLWALPRSDLSSIAVPTDAAVVTGDAAAQGHHAQVV